MVKTTKRKRLIAVAVAAVIVVLLAADLFAGNYLVSFALERSSASGSAVAPEDSHRWVIAVHGYTGGRQHMYAYGAYYAERGYNVLTPDLCAHGESEGRYIGMGWLDRKDILKWIGLILDRDNAAEIVLHGVSMGGGTVMMTAGEDLPENVVAVVNDCGYTSVWDVFSDELEYLFRLPDFPFLYTASAIAKLRAGYTFGEASSLEQVKKAGVPMLFMHGSQDNFVHTEMVYRLYDACPTDKELFIAKGAGAWSGTLSGPGGIFQLRVFISGTNGIKLKKEKETMIKVIARTLVREECIEAYHTLAKELVTETQKESGNISYTLNQSVENKKLHAMIEVWESGEALDAHMASEHFKRIVPQMAEYAEEKYPLELYSEV